MLHADGDGGIQNVLRGLHVHAQRVRWVGVALGDVVDGGEVEDILRLQPGKRPRRRRRIREVHFDDRHVRQVLDARRDAAAVVQQHDLAAARAELPSEFVADEAEAAGDEVHVSLRCSVSSRATLGKAAAASKPAAPVRPPSTNTADDAGGECRATPGR